MKFHFVINPQSGNFNYQEVVDYIRVYVQKNPDFLYDLHLTQHIGHATEIVKSIEGDDQCVIACGGDGTLNEVLNGLNEGVKLACIPLGSGNDFARMLKYPKGLSTPEWIEETINGRLVKVDYGVVNGERFINSCNTGIDALVLVEFERMRKWLLPKNVVYLLATLKTVLKPFSNKLKFTINNQEPFESESLLCTLMNGKYYGNGYTPTPQSEINDRVLDLCYVVPLSLVKIASLIKKYSVGTHISHPSVHMYEIKTLLIDSEQEILYGIDGEIRYAKQMDCKVSDHQIEFMVSRKAGIL